MSTREAALRAALQEAREGFQLIVEHPPMPDTMREIARQERDLIDTALDAEVISDEH